MNPDNPDIPETKVSHKKSPLHKRDFYLIHSLDGPYHPTTKLPIPSPALSGACGASFPEGKPPRDTFESIHLKSIPAL
jgi:hypothetical protein